ncbi:hypothetical protein BJX68DRAFT_124418 [Aspergillus pseudodeflectus]|uniref:Uncharacterized protein n=1 Tax=Aspergillus pseudodeflectus TaxID=176178 RepID=A0ABR4K2J0_9EURO
MDPEDSPPQPAQSDPTSTQPNPDPTSNSQSPDPYTTRTEKRKGKFRFKTKHSSSRSSRHDYHRSHKDRDRHHGHRSSSHHRRSKRRKHRTPSPSSAPGPGPGPGNAPLSPNTAFRESLFDALGDDEGAAFWESVYGQPIPAPPSGGDSRGPLEQMDEEAYASYVRGEMWKRTREGMLEEAERMRAEKRAKVKAEREAESARERRAFEDAMEGALRRGRERKKMKEVWKGVWREYVESWERVENAVRGGKEGGESNGEDRSKGGKWLRELLFWPVQSGRRRDISKENVEEFMRRAPVTAWTSDRRTGSSEAAPEDLFVTTLKAERVRWHPDKIQHRYGSLGNDETVMRSVTEVFQIVDTLWNEAKR